MLFNEKTNGRHIKHNIFAKYFVLFATIFLVVLGVLGFTLTLLVNAYTQSENTKLLRENVDLIVSSVSSTMIDQDMNDRYSIEKGMICNTLDIVCSSIDADIFVCDNEGNIIMCREKGNETPYLGRLPVCTYHNRFTVDSAMLQGAFEGSFIGKAKVNGTTSYIVGKPVYYDDLNGKQQIIGTVFGTTPTTADSLTLSVMRMFILSALVCLVAAFIAIWKLTKNFVKPLRQMSTAAKKFAIGDFSYRVKITSDDELADLGRAFNDMADSLDTLESSRRSFVSNVSHELRTPMTSIGGFIDGILDGTIPKDKQDYYLNIVSGEIRRLSRLVVAMLNMSKIESGSFEMKPSNYDISDQIIHILLTFEQRLRKRILKYRDLRIWHQPILLRIPI